MRLVLPSLNWSLIELKCEEDTLLGLLNVFEYIEEIQLNLLVFSELCFLLEAFNKSYQNDSKMDE